MSTLNNSEPKNIFVISVTDDVFHSSILLTNGLIFANAPLISITSFVFQN